MYAVDVRLSGPAHTLRAGRSPLADTVRTARRTSPVAGSGAVPVQAFAAAVGGLPPWLHDCAAQQYAQAAERAPGPTSWPLSLSHSGWVTPAALHRSFVREPTVRTWHVLTPTGVVAALQVEGRTTRSVGSGRCCPTGPQTRSACTTTCGAPILRLRPWAGTSSLVKGRPAPPT